MNQTLRKMLLWGGGTLAGVLFLVLVLPFLVPLDGAKTRIETAAASATGRTVRIEGPLRLMFFPRLGVRAHELTLANVPGGRAAVLASVGDVEISVKAMPLLTGRVAIDRIVLDKPVIALEVDRAGAENWKFAKPAGTAALPARKGTLTLPATTEFEGLEIHDGAVTYDNAKTGTHRAIEHVNVDVAITRIDRPVSATGDFTVKDRKVAFAAELATLKAFLGTGTTSLSLSADAELMTVRFKGTLTEDGTTEGRFALSSSSFRNLAAWLDEPLPGGGLGALSLTSQVWNKEKVTRLDDLHLVLDNQTITGNLSIDAHAKTPAINGTLAVNHLDLNPYLASGAPHQDEPAGQTGWSRKAFSVGLLKKFDGTLSVSTASLRVRGLHLGNTSFKLVNNGGVATASLDPISLYGGTGQAELTIDARGTHPVFRNKLLFKNISLGPLLADSIGVTSIEGTGALTLDAAASGNSAYAIMHTLNGRGTIAGANGRFKGVDLGRVARTIQSVLGGDATGKIATTDFTAMTASFTIANGVLANNDFRLTGPAVQVNGGGRVDIANRGLDFRIEPKAGVSGFAVGVPFRITGGWDKPHFAPDFADLIGGVVDNLKNGRAAFKGLFGGGNKANNAPNDGKKKKGGLLDALGIH